MTSWTYPDDLPSKSEIVRFWINRLYCLRIFINWYKPKCWACGFNYGGRYDVPFPKNSREDIYRAWERLPLQRCHIVARGLNGAQSSGNLFLMCRECHDSAPNTTIPQIFFDWARSQNTERRENAKLREAFRSFRIPEDMYETILRVCLSPEFVEWSAGKSGIHRPQSNYATVSARLTPATTIGLAQHYLKYHALRDFTVR